MKIRTYTELRSLPTFAQRFQYLKIGGQVGTATFGFDRYLNQALYRSEEWREARNAVILRDGACDLGIGDRQIKNRILIHHMNPITQQQINDRHPSLYDPEFLICCSHRTHNAIHYGAQDPTPIFVQRKAGDTCPWAKAY